MPSSLFSQSFSGPDNCERAISEGCDSVVKLDVVSQASDILAWLMGASTTLEKIFSGFPMEPSSSENPSLLCSFFSEGDERGSFTLK